MRTLNAVFKAFETDPEGASDLVDEAVSTWMAEVQAAYAVPLDTHIAKHLAARVALAKRALARSYAEVMVSGHYPDDSVHKTAEWLAGLDRFTKAVLDEAEVAKALTVGDETWHFRDGRRVKRAGVVRDSGRFARQIDIRGHSTPISAAELSPHLAGKHVLSDEAGTRWAEGIDSDEALKAKAGRHQAQWEQAAKHAQELAGEYTGSTQGVNLVFHLVSDDGNQAFERVPLSRVRRGGLEGIPNLNPLDQQILSVQLERPDQGALLSATGALEWAQGIPQPTWAGALGRGDVNEPGTTRAFGRLRAGGDILSAVPGAEKAGKLASLVGELGPEAENVLGPHIRQAAYRYRGTERTPDSGLVRDLTSDEAKVLTGAAHAGRGAEYAARLQGGAETRTRAGQGMRGEVPAVGAAAFRAGQGQDGDQLAMGIGADVSAMHLIDTLPKDSLTAELSEASGHVLPSQGVLLDRKGEIVSQAVGFADDHYLPFDLKNLKSLRGGQYVRTRVQGGLTGEDIYAAINAGARRVTVVSSSGVFTLELAPTFRGARGNSDKARSMTRRYLQILDAVENSGLYLKDLTGPEKNEVRRLYELAHPDYDPDNRESRKEHEAGLEAALNKRRRAKMQIGEAEDKALWEESGAQAASELRGGRGGTQELARRTADIYDEKLEAARDEAGVHKLALNAAGYATALATLQRQFPYFIREAGYESLPDFLENRDQLVSPGLARNRSRSKDRGYVQPGGIRPASVRSGFYNPAGGLGTGLAPAKTQRGQAAAPAPGSAGGAGQGPAAGGAPGGAAPASPAAPGAAPATPLGNKLTDLSQVAQAQSKKAAQNLRDVLGLLTKRPTEFTGKSWDEVRESPKQAKAIALLTMSNDQLVQTLSANPEAAAVLYDTDTVKRALPDAFDMTQDEIDQYGPDGTKQLPDGADSQTTLVDLLAHRAQVIADAASMTQPFETTAPDAANPFTPNTRPFADPELMTVTDARSFDELSKVDPYKSARADAARYFGTDGRPMPVYAANDLARTYLQVLREANSEVTHRRIADKRLDLKDNKLDTDVHAQLAGIDAKALRAALGGQELDYSGNIKDQLERAARNLQRAWTMEQIERSMEALHGGPEGAAGDVVPKGPARRFPKPQPVGKASSSPRVRLLSEAHPISKALRAHRARSTSSG